MNEKIKAMRTIGIWFEFGGVEVKAINDEKCYCVVGDTAHKRKVHWTVGSIPYITLFNRRLKLSECLRV